jgi:hypothetical protein
MAVTGHEAVDALALLSNDGLDYWDRKVGKVWQPALYEDLEAVDVVEKPVGRIFEFLTAEREASKLAFVRARRLRRRVWKANLAFDRTHNGQ